jgi:hypothetical protein
MMACSDNSGDNNDDGERRTRRPAGEAEEPSDTDAVAETATPTPTPTPTEEEAGAFDYLELLNEEYQETYLNKATKLDAHDGGGAVIIDNVAYFRMVSFSDEDSDNTRNDDRVNMLSLDLETHKVKNIRLKDVDTHVSAVYVYDNSFYTFASTGQSSNDKKGSIVLYRHDLSGKLLRSYDQFDNAPSDTMLSFSEEGIAFFNHSSFSGRKGLFILSLDLKETQRIRNITVDIGRGKTEKEEFSASSVLGIEDGHIYAQIRGQKFIEQGVYAFDINDKLNPTFVEEDDVPNFNRIGKYHIKDNGIIDSETDEKLTEVRFEPKNFVGAFWLSASQGVLTKTRHPRSNMFDGGIIQAETEEIFKTVDKRARFVILSYEYFIVFEDAGIFLELVGGTEDDAVELKFPS